MTSNDFQVLCVQSSYNQPITTAFTFLIFNTSTTSALLPSMMLLLLALTTFRRHFNADFLSIISWGIMCSVELQLSAAWIRNRVDVDIRSPRTKTISLLFITSALRYHFQIPKGRQKLQTHMKCRVKVIKTHGCKDTYGVKVNKVEMKLAFHFLRATKSRAREQTESTHLNRMCGLWLEEAAKCH